MVAYYVYNTVYTAPGELYLGKTSYSVTQCEFDGCVIEKII